jgi:hypothetical protein
MADDVVAALNAFTDLPQVRVRVEFLRVRPPSMGERKVHTVIVPHVSRAEYVAREQLEGLRSDEWALLSVVVQAFEEPSK